MKRTYTTQLTPREFAYVAGLGLYRLRSAEEANRKPRGGIRQSDIGVRYAADIEGMCGEYAVAKLLGFATRPEEFKPLVNALDRDGDLPGGIQIKTTIYNPGHLIIDRSADGSHRYVHVTGKYGAYTIHGWGYARDLMTRKALDLGRQKAPAHRKEEGAYWVKPDVLREMDELIRDLLAPTKPVMA